MTVQGNAPPAARPEMDFHVAIGQAGYAISHFLAPNTLAEGGLRSFLARFQFGIEQTQPMPKIVTIGHRVEILEQKR